MKILIVGSVHVEMGLAGSYYRAFGAADCRVLDFDLDAEYRAQLPAPRLSGRVAGHVDFPNAVFKANRRLAMYVEEKEPDVVVVICNAPVRAGTLIQMKVNRPGLRIVNVYPDPLINLHDYVLKSLPLYDLFCTHTRAAVPLLERMGAHAFYLPLAADPTIYKPVELTEEDRQTFGADLSYVGNWRPEHEHLFTFLMNFNLAVWGPRYWKTRAKDGFVRGCYRGREITSPEEYAKAYIAARIGLNPIDRVNGPSHNMRLFEVPACGVFTLAQRTPEVLELFEEGETIATFGEPVELSSRAHHYFTHDAERERIARRSYEYVLERHTYRHRVGALLAAL